MRKVDLGTQGPRKRSSGLDFLNSIRHGQRHSASDVLLNVLQRRRSSAVERLSSSTHRVMAAVSSVSIAETNTNLSGSKSITRRPTAKYTKVGERLRHVIPGHMQCSMACGGRACKYENPSRWSDEEQAIKGLYSSWITDNLLAMARPSTEIIEKYNIIKQFQRYDVKTIINLQRPGEHASCGNSLEQESGFTYRPEIFMDAGIYFYNFGWKDYGVASLITILDMVKVMSFAMQEGKMAIHCHAGLGRTGVLLACYLVFAVRMTADQAILFVRAKRPNSIQTRGQLLCVREFAQFLIPLRNVFACAEPKANAVTLSQYLIRQRHLLHGYEARQLKNVPKIVQLICKLLLDIAENRQVIEEEDLEIPDLSAEIEKTVSQLAILQLDKELHGKGVEVSKMPKAEFVPSDSVLPSENEFGPLWKRRNAECLQPLSYLKKRLSYSDSDLRRAEFLLEHRGPPLTMPAGMLCPNSLSKQCLSQNNLQSCIVTEPSKPNFSTLFEALQSGNIKQDPFCLTTSSVWDQKKVISTVEQNGSPLFQRRKHPKEVQRSRTFSLGSSSVKTSNQPEGPRKNTKSEAQFDSGGAKQKESSVNGKSACVLQGNNSSQSPLTEAPTSSKTVFHIGEEDTDSSEEIPFITLQSELTLESRRVLVAQALAVDLDCDGDAELIEKVESWQRELNSREGAWDRICTERDPFVLSGLIWSWLEQLKEPVITKEDIQILAQKCDNPDEAIYTLEKGPQQTIVSIVDCVAHLHSIPEDVEEAFLARITKAFTKITFDAADGPMVYSTLKAILRPVLHEKRRGAIEESENSCYCLYCP
ncbi:protein tyrosine phosphatase domain-containing protein 1-like isoform X1 [Acipenser oxyrinchus oxyrinchus]|uniref:Protein tyrosine phosphatase domain-containing protein 1 n=1 Tax=Acipenser oxyrinchus oxyrinchus TaxID=40147 RepID=A0AAD8FYL0_ACIOX|nr:protein tyrosine phosphatase domain-containing protein 1-like isoform X1 [Acipenser oxyrinchus oxyrinchus]